MGLQLGVNYLSVNEKLSSEALHSLTSLSGSLMTNIDAQLRNMDRISMTPVFSHVLQRNLRKVWTDPTNADDIIDLMSSVNGALTGVRQITFYDPSGQLLAIGNPEGFLRENVTPGKPLWFDTVVRQLGQSLILGPEIDPLIESRSVPDKGHVYISVFRSYRDPQRAYHGVIQVEQDCSAIFGELDLLSHNRSNGRRFVILSDTGRVIYPYRETIADSAWIQKGRPVDLSIQVQTILSPQNGKPYVLAYHHSLESDWCLAIIQDEAKLYADVPDFSRQIFLNAVLVCGVALIGAFWLARRVSSPLHRLSSLMEHFTWKSSQANVLDTIPSSGIAELEKLTVAFQRLQIELQTSFAEAVLLRAHKHRAQLLALQAQMNPHFMFNMLATISVMAEMGMEARIPAVVDDLADMMRYIASGEELAHSLAEEFRFIEKYLSCMKLRFADDLIVSWDIPPHLKVGPVPRLILQPFIENALKHMSHRRPPWELVIQARTTETQWCVTILDSGPGFDRDVLVDLEAEFARIRTLVPDATDLPSLHVEGMGLLNSFTRLHLTYGEALIMSLENRPSGGASVTVGGTHGD